MVYILNIETATTNCSVSLTLDGQTLLVKEDYNDKYSHAERLHFYIDYVLQQAGIKVLDLNAIAVSKGPGSYTGLRIGVSTVKGLCYSLNIPLISVPTLESLAYQVKINDGVIIPMLDARRLEVYDAIFDSDYNQIRATQAELLDKTSFRKYLNKTTVNFIGNGVAKTKNLVNHKNAIFIDHKLPSSKEMGLLSFMKYKKNDFEDIAYFEPYYLKDFVATKPNKG